MSDIRAVIVGERTIAELRAGRDVTLKNLGVVLIPESDLCTDAAGPVPEMVHRVAEALRASCRGEYGSDWCFDVAWKFARAAIAEMREPTEAMVAAGEAVEIEGSVGYRYMIDAALRPNI